jgi:hypothetical protein
MDKDELNKLNPGDIVQNLGSGNTYVIIEVISIAYCSIPIAIRAVTITNPSEWKKVNKNA